LLNVYLYIYIYIHIFDVTYINIINHNHIYTHTYIYTHISRQTWGFKLGTAISWRHADLFAMQFYKFGWTFSCAIYIYINRYINK
jgi:hypothetical protein